MNDLSLSGAVLALTMLEKSLNLNVVNLLTANNYKEYKITSADESLEINLKGNELKELSNFTEDIFDYIGDEYGIDTTFDRNDDESFCEVLTTLFNHYIKEHNDYIDEMHPEDANNKIPHKIEFMENYLKILNNLRMNANEYDYEDDILNCTTDYLVLMGYELKDLESTEVKALIDATNDMLEDQIEKRESDANPFYHYLHNKKKLEHDKLKELNLDRIKLLIYNRVFRNVHGILSNATGYDNVLCQHFIDNFNTDQRLLFHDRKTAPIENEMYKIKLFNSITKQPYENTSEQEDEVIELFNKELQVFTQPQHIKAHLDYIKNLIMLMSITNIGYERQLLGTYIVTLLSIIVPQKEPVKNIRDCFVFGVGKGRIDISDLEDIIRNNYEAIKDPQILRNAIKSVKESLKNPQNFNTRIIDLGKLDLGISLTNDNMDDFFNSMLEMLDNLDNSIGLSNEDAPKIDIEKIFASDEEKKEEDPNSDEDFSPEQK